jgi:hypothetical protein
MNKRVHDVKPVPVPDIQKLAVRSGKFVSEHCQFSQIFTSVTKSYSKKNKIKWLTCRIRYAQPSAWGTRWLAVYRMSPYPADWSRHRTSPATHPATIIHMKIFTPKPIQYSLTTMAFKDNTVSFVFSNFCRRKIRSFYLHRHVFFKMVL